MSLKLINSFRTGSLHSEHHQQVDEVPVLLITLSNERLQCNAFLHKICQYSASPETLIERLNDSEIRFLAFRTSDGIRIINLNWISTIEFNGVSAEVEKRIEEQCQRETVEFLMKNGESVYSDVLYGLPAANSRISDLLNTPQERFLLTFDGTITRYVNRDAVNSAQHIRSVPWQS